MAHRFLSVPVMTLALVAAITPAVAQAATRGASVTTISPTVDVRAKGSHTFVRVATSKKVSVGTTVRTGAQGIAQVDYGDGSFTRLDRHTKFLVKRLTDKTGKRQIATHLISGKTFNRVAKLTQSESFTQTTNGAKAGVIGTTFAVAWTGKNKTSTYTLVKGTLTLRAHGKKKPVHLTAGQRVVIVKGVPRPVQTLTPAELCADSWICSNLNGPNSPRQIAAGQLQSCALLNNGTAKCWGDNSDGALGNGVALNGPSPANSNSPTPVNVVGLSDGTSISTGGNPTGYGYQHSCAVLADRTVECWGRNTGGELGNGTTSNYSSTPVPVAGLTDAIDVSVNDFHSCAVLENGSVKCWGGNSGGELGNATTTDASTPVAVAGITEAKAITTGYLRSCALLKDGTVECWGKNTAGQLGNDTVTDHSAIPVPVTGLTNVVAIAGGAEHTCALLSDATLECWGANNSDQLGNAGLTTSSSTAPVAVTGLEGVAAVAAGADHSCAALNDGTVKCWGGSTYGQLGPASQQASTTPVLVTGLRGVINIAAGSYHSCALLTNGSVECWGRNDSGQLGDGTKTQSSKPVAVIRL